MKGQLSLTVPTKHINTRGMTRAQRQAWMTLRALGEPVTVGEFARWTGYYNWPRGAIQRMLRRGLIIRVGRGTYKAYTPGERKR